MACAVEEPGEAKVALGPWVGVWRISRTDPAAAAPPFGAHRLPVWGIEIEPHGRFHLLHAGKDGDPIRQVGFDAAGNVTFDSVYGGLIFTWPGHGVSSTQPKQISESEIEFSFDAAQRAFGLTRWSGEVFCAKGVPPAGTRAGAAGCSAPEYGLTDTFRSETDLWARLVGRWAVCSSTVNGTNAARPTPAGIEVAEDLQVWELRPNDKGDLVRGSLIGPMQLISPQTHESGMSWLVNLNGWSFGQMVFSDAPVKLNWKAYESTHFLSRLP